MLGPAISFWNCRVGGGCIGPTDAFFVMDPQGNAFRIGEGVGSEQIIDESAPSLDPDAQAYVNAMTITPDAARQALINDLIVGLKADGVWTALAGGWVSLANGDEQQMRLNMVDPTQEATAVNSPTFTADRGFQGNGSTSYLSTGVDSGDVSSSTNGTLFRWINIDPSSNNSDDIGSGDRYRIRTAADGSALCRLNQSNNTTAATGSFHCVVREDASTSVSYVDGGSPNTVSPISATSSGEIFILRASSFSDSRAAVAGFTPSSLSAAQVLALYNRLNTYVTAIGAN